MKLVILGAGKMAHAIAHDLLTHDDVTELWLADVRQDAAQSLAKTLDDPRVRTAALDVNDAAGLARLLQGARCTVGSTTYKHNLQLTKACIAAKSSFCDLGGNVGVVQAQKALSAEAEAAGVTVIPDCGLAPGMVNVLAYHWAQRFDRVDSVKIRVGGLPQKPQNDLRYALVFSVEGLINEYVEDAEVVRRGKKVLVPSLSGVEPLRFPKPFGELEAFYTSGGASSLPDLLGGKVRELDYKTIRYPGHAAQMKLLMDLGLMSSTPWELGEQKLAPRRVLAEALSRYLPSGVPDAVLVRIEIAGKQGKQKRRVTWDCVDKLDKKTGLSAMQRTTGFPVAIIAHMLASGQIAKRGVHAQELAVPAEAFEKALAQRRIVFSKRQARA